MSNTWWKDVDELVPEQASVLDIDTDKSLLIQGPPGSGKTNLLLLRANQLHIGDRPNLHVVVFGSLLRRFIQMGGQQYKFPDQKIITDTRLFSQILQSENADFDATKMKLPEARRERANRLERLLKEGKVGIQFDALLLDEAQDYTSQEIRVLRQLTEVLIATADSRQRIYDVDDCTGTLANCTDLTYGLKYHFRNGLAICRLADGIFKNDAAHAPLSANSNYKEKDYPSKVTPRAGLSLAEQANAIAQQIGDQRLGYPNELIGVLCPTNSDLNAIQEGLEAAGIGDIITRANSEAFDCSKPVWLSTLSAAKGLEFRALHIAGLDNLHKTGSNQKRLIYTGITRAKSALTLYWHHQIPGYLESALRALEPVKGPVTTASIFGKA